MAKRALLKGRNILLVEDEMMVAMLLQSIMEDAGCKVICAGYLEQATALAREQELDAAVVDVNLHGEKSYPVADALAARAIPFVFATGYGAADLQRLYPGRPVLAKPYNADDLILVLSGIIVTPPGKG